MNSKSTGSIFKAGVMAAVIAAVVNAILFLIGSTFTFPDTALTPMGQPIVLPAVIFMSFVPVLLGTGVYWALNRFMSGNADRIFVAISVIVLVFMIPGPFGIENVDIAQIVILQIMHVVAGGSAIYFLTQR